MCRHEGGHDHAPGSFDVVAIEAAQRQPATGEALKQERANVGLVLAAAGDCYQVSDLELRG
jgi:hypothetical protein